MTSQRLPQCRTANNPQVIFLSLEWQQAYSHANILIFLLQLEYKWQVPYIRSSQQVDPSGLVCADLYLVRPNKRWSISSEVEVAVYCNFKPLHVH